MQTDTTPEMTGSSVIKNNKNMMGKLPLNCCFHGNKHVYFTTYKLFETLTKIYKYVLILSF